MNSAQILHIFFRFTSTLHNLQRISESSVNSVRIMKPVCIYCTFVAPEGVNHKSFINFSEFYTKLLCTGCSSSSCKKWEQYCQQSAKLSHFCTICSTELNTVQPVNSAGAETQNTAISTYKLAGIIWKWSQKGCSRDIC